MRIVLASAWRNDAARDLESRAAALRAKIGVNLWIFAVGESTDDTLPRLRAWAAGDRRVEVVEIVTGIVGEDPASRLSRLSITGDLVLGELLPDRVDRVVWHESDLDSPLDVVPRLDGGDLEARAGWVTLPLPGGAIFYDSWAYRAEGQHFSSWPPYSPAYRPDGPFPVDSAGSVLSVPGWVIRDGARCAGWGLVGLCRACRRHGVGVVVDPSVPIEQPLAYWSPQVGVPIPEGFERLP